MEVTTFKEELLVERQDDNILFNLNILDTVEMEVYPKSIHTLDDVIFFISKQGCRKFLYLYFENTDSKIPVMFEGSLLTLNGLNRCYLKKCPQNSYNRKMLQSVFDFTNPTTLGLTDSFGFGDRLGLANPAHLRALAGSNFKPVVAQQSIRELGRTNRTPAEVMDAAVWAVFQEGYHEGFGADADHLKTTADIDLMVKNGYRMFTFDPGQYVHNQADTLNNNELKEPADNQNWKALKTDYEGLISNYIDKDIFINDNLSIRASENELRRALIKYGDVLVQIKKMYNYLKSRFPLYISEVEISVDETESVTTPFEHYFIANELKRLGVKVVSLAPRFVGSFEKGIDYKGDLELFREEFIKHISIAQYFGTYKLSLHSGSDKFSIYKVIGSLKSGITHVKTAGTSYLEALKVIAVKNPALFREILDYSRNIYPTEKESYLVSADVNNVCPSDSYSDQDLTALFDINDIRQILHVAYGRILTDKTEGGEYLFKNRIYECLNNNEELYYKFLIDHFHKHLDAFK